jgi:hypothetical protein
MPYPKTKAPILDHLQAGFFLLMDRLRLRFLFATLEGHVANASLTGRIEFESLRIRSAQCDALEAFSEAWGSWNPMHSCFAISMARQSCPTISQSCEPGQ